MGGEWLGALGAVRKGEWRTLLKAAALCRWRILLVMLGRGRVGRYERVHKERMVVTFVEYMYMLWKQ